MMDPNLPGVVSDEEEDVASLEQKRMAAVRGLQRFVARHNWSAALLALFSLATAAVLWGLVYLVVYWFSLTVVTIKRGLDADTLLEVNDPQLLGAHFSWWFLGGAALALIASRIVARKLRMESLREARHYLLWVTVELLMAIPNVTFSIWGNLSALVSLRRAEAENAWHLLERVDQEGGRLSAASLRLEIDDEHQLQHVLFALQIVGLVEMRERKEGWFLFLQDRDTFALLSRTEPT